MTTVRQSPLAGAEMMTFLAPAVMWPLAFSTSVNRPVDSITSSTPSAFHGSSAGDLALTTLISLPLTMSTSSPACRRRISWSRPALEAALDGIIFEQVRQIVRRHDIADRDHLDVLAHHALFDERAEDQATDAPEPVDCNFHCHSFYHNLPATCPASIQNSGTELPNVNRFLHGRGKTGSPIRDSFLTCLVGFGFSGVQFELERVQGEVDVPDECDHGAKQRSHGADENEADEHALLPL
jgi:hypothetical protein